MTLVGQVAADKAADKVVGTAADKAALAVGFAAAAPAVDIQVVVGTAAAVPAVSTEAAEAAAPAACCRAAVGNLDCCPL